MKTMTGRFGLVLAVMAGVLAFAFPADARPSTPRDGVSYRLTRKGAAGQIAVRAGKKQFPADAEVSIERARPDDAKRRIHKGWSTRRECGKGAASPKRARRLGSGTSAASPSVLASYDIAIKAGGKKWQPDAGDPVRVTVELDEPVAIAAASTLGVVHLSDDGTVEELPASRYGFTYNEEKTAVTAFWFSAEGFSVYSIVDMSGTVVTPRRFYHFYDHPSAIEGSEAVRTFPYRYVDSSNAVINVQIVKDGDMLLEPPIPPDIMDANTNLVSTFEGWYVVQTNAHTTMHGLNVAESKLDSTTVPFEFVWPVGVTGHRLAFTNAISFAEGETGDTDYFVVPLYEHSRFVQFYESSEEAMQAPDATVRIVGRRLVALNDETHSMRVKVSDVTAPLRNSRGEYFSGWEYYRHKTDAKPTQILTYSAQGVAQEAFLDVDDALFEANRTEENGGHVIPMWPVYVEAHFLSFSPALPKGSGAVYVGSVFVKSESDIRTTEVSARPGYDFGGWWTGINHGDDKVPDVEYGQQVTDAAGAILPNLSIAGTDGGIVVSSDANGKISLGEDVTLYAKWIPQANATYRVIIWQQKVTDAKDAANADKTYDYVTHYTSGKIHSDQSVTEAMLRSFSGTTTQKGSVSGLNVLSATALANRTEVTATGVSFTGFETTARWSVSNTESDGTVKSDNSTIVNVYFDRKLITLSFYQNNSLYTQMTGLYGQTLAENDYSWPEGVWQTTKDGTTTTTTFLDGFMPTTGEDERYNYSTSSSGRYPISFYKQALDGSYGAAANTVNANGNNFNVSDKYNGFTASVYRKKTSTNGSWGDWTSVGTLNESTGYYGSQVSSYSALEIRFARNEYAFIYRDADTGENVFATNMLFEASLAGLDLSPTDARIDWKGRDTEHYTFDGWYEDASGSVPFDFSNGKMPSSTKVVFAVWKPVKYKVIIDPNGGQLEGNDSTWFYVDYNELVSEYTPTRDYRLDMSGEYYYSLHDYNEKGDKHVTSPSSPDFIPNISRRAYYTANADEATDTFNRYAYEEGAYRFMGWYEVLADGTVDSAPFAFGTAHNRPLTIRAVWQRSGLYRLKYESIDPSGERPTEIWFDPEGAENGKGGYISEGVTTLSKDPTNYNRDDYVWEGWQVIDPRQNNLPLTNIRSPGDVYIVHASHADSDNVIHMRAVYSRRGSGTSRHIPPVVDLVLDSNDGAGLAAGFTTDPSLTGVGTYTDGTAGNISGLNEGVWFAGQQNNFSVNLADYSRAFAHDDGFLLLGWDTNRVSTTGIPAYYANEKIGVDTSTLQENVLYAVWEPQIYIDITNATDDVISGITLYIPGWIDGKAYKLESLTDIYHRSEFTAFRDGTATFSLAAGENLRLVIPDGYHKDFTVSGSSPYTESATTGTKLIVTRTTPEIEGETHAADYVSVAYAGESYTVSGTMHVSPEPVQVRFEKATYQTSTTVPVRYFLHLTNTTDGVVREITHDDTYWRKVGGKDRVTNITVRAADIDLAAHLRVSSSQAVHEFLADVRPDDGALLRDGFRHTTIGIGSATSNAADFAEYRSITKRDTSGGSYIHYQRERVEWSRYEVVWNAYNDPAVYVVFYRREPVHVTVAKSVTGAEEDKERAFEFTADFEDHSKTFEYTVTTKYKKERTLRSNAVRGGFLNLSWEWSDSWNGDDWSQCEEQVDETGVPSVPQLVSTDMFLFSPGGREREEFSLADRDRHPLTIYFNTLMDTDPSKTLTTGGRVELSGISYYERNGSESTGWGASSAGNGKYRTRTETTNWTQTVTYIVTYQYETVTIREKNDPDNVFVLTSIAGDPDNELVNHNGTANIAERSYTISSWRGPDASGFYTHQLLDTAIFHNRRKTGSVTVTKAVEGGNGDESFTFRLTLGETVVDKDGYVPPEGVHLGPYGKVFTFSLANGGSVTLPGLPVDATYAVEEIPDPLFISEAPANASGTIAEGTATVAFTNTRKTDLLIQMKSREAAFNGGEQTGSEIHEVTGTGTAVDAASYTVTGLKAGHVLTVEHHVPARGTAVGTYSGHFENARFTVHDANGADVTGEYLVTATPSSLTIVPAKLVVTIVGNTETRSYNGEEQAVEGYTYTVVRKSDGAPVGDNEVHPVIEPAYSKAKGTDVGTYSMSLLGGAAVGFVKNDGYQIAPEDIHITNGSLTIEPRPATVTADDKAKIAGCPDPAFTATVTGLVGGDNVNFALSRAAGEEVGAYAITVTGEAKQGNYSVTYVPGTLTIRTLDLIQRATGEGLPVSVPIDGSVLRAIGLDGQDMPSPDEIGSFLNQFDGNGLRRWENLVTGTAFDQLLLNTVSGNSATISAKMVADPDASIKKDLGYTVLRELRKKGDGDAWRTVAGPFEAGNPSFDIALADGEGNSVNASGLYRLVTLIVPKCDLSITNEIPSKNIIGVLEVDSAITNTVVAVPWKQLASDPKSASNITVANYVSTLNLTPGDHVYAFEEIPSKGASSSGGATYMMWTLQSDGTWTSATTIKSSEPGYSVMSVAEDAETKEFARTQAVWLQRQRPLDKDGKPVPFFLIGQYDADGVEITVKGGTSSEPGYTLLSVPDYRDYSINDLDWSGYASAADSTDFIRVVDGSQSFLLKWSDGKWCTEEVNYRRGRPAGMKYVPYVTPFKAGTGFWFCRHGGEFTIKWAPSEEVQ